jgi:hypothetical protein
MKPLAVLCALVLPFGFAPASSAQTLTFSTLFYGFDGYSATASPAFVTPGQFFVNGSQWQFRHADASGALHPGTPQERASVLWGEPWTQAGPSSTSQIMSLPFSLTVPTGYAVTLDSISFMYRLDPSASTIDYTLEVLSAPYSTSGSFFSGGSNWRSTAFFPALALDTGSHALAFFKTSLNPPSNQGLYFDDLRLGFSLTALNTGPAIPEPSTYAAFAGLAALGLAVWQRRRASPTVRQ